MSQEIPSRKQLAALLDRIEAARQTLRNPRRARPLDCSTLDLNKSGDRALVCRRIRDGFGFDWSEVSKMSDPAIAQTIADTTNARWARLHEKHAEARRQRAPVTPRQIVRRPSDERPAEGIGHKDLAHAIGITPDYLTKIVNATDGVDGPGTGGYHTFTYNPASVWKIGHTHVDRMKGMRRREKWQTTLERFGLDFDTPPKAKSRRAASV